MPPATDHTYYLVWTGCLAGDSLPLCRPVVALNDRIVGLKHSLTLPMNVLRAPSYFE